MDLSELQRKLDFARNIQRVNWGSGGLGMMPTQPLPMGEPLMGDPGNPIPTGLGALLKSMIYFHGSPLPFAKAIREAGHLLPTKAVGKQVSGGLPAEHDLIWATPRKDLAAKYADPDIHPDVMAMSYNKEKLGLAKGNVFETDDIKGLKFIDPQEPLTKNQVEIINKYLPHYKPIHEGEALWQAVVHRSNGHLSYGQAAKLLGYDGIKQGKTKTGEYLQYGFAQDRLPVKFVE